MSEALSHFPWTGLTCLALLIFMGLFAGVLFRVLNPRNRELFEHMKQLPFEGDLRHD